MISVKLLLSGGLACFEIEDNGIGLPPKYFDLDKVNSPGWKLIRGLMKDLYATIRFEAGLGTKIILCVEHDVLVYPKV